MTCFSQYSLVIISISFIGNQIVFLHELNVMSVISNLRVKICIVIFTVEDNLLN